MFAADLSWKDDTVENMRQRRERKDKQRENSISSSGSSEPSPSSAPSSSVSGSLRRPSFSLRHRNRKPRQLPPPIHENVQSDLFRDPELQPNWTLQGRLVRKLPSGENFDPPPPFPVYTHGAADPKKPHYKEDPLQNLWIGNRQEADDFCQKYDNVKDKILALQTTCKEVPPSPKSHPIHSSPYYRDESRELHSAVHELGEASPRLNHQQQRRPEREYQLPPTPNFSVDMPAVLKSVTISVENSPYQAPIDPAEAKSFWEAPTAWGFFSGTKESKRSSSLSNLTPASPNSSVSPYQESIIREDPPSAPSQHFQRLVQRMDSASAKVIHDRLLEDWSDTTDPMLREELELEKHLWALTAVENQTLDKFARPSQSAKVTNPLPPITLNKRRKILELDGHLGELYRLVSVYPSAKIAHLATQPASSQAGSILLPPTVKQHPVPPSLSHGTASATSANCAVPLPLPYASASMHHIRSSQLPSLLPAAQLPALLADCHRILKPGGVLELRIVDAVPQQGSMGPKLAAWLEDRLLQHLDDQYRCSRPSLLVQQWASDAGFAMLHGGKLGLLRCLRLAAAGARGGHDVLGEVGAAALREVWKDAWGKYVQHYEVDPGASNSNSNSSGAGSASDGQAQPLWWWADDDLVRECQQWGTAWDVGTLVVVKQDGRR